MPEADGIPTSAEVAQAAPGGARQVVGLRPVVPGLQLVGPAATCACAPEDNLALHRALATAPDGAVLVCATGGGLPCGHFGELMATDARAAGVRGLVIDGPVRDAAALAAMRFPVFHRSLAPAPCVKERSLAVGALVVVGGVEVAPGDVVVADDDAVLVVTAADWPDVVAAVATVREGERRVRDGLARGRRLAELLELPPQGAA